MLKLINPIFNSMYNQHIAASNGDTRSVRLLLDYGANPNIRGIILSNHSEILLLFLLGPICGIGVGEKCSMVGLVECHQVKFFYCFCFHLIFLKFFVQRYLFKVLTMEHFLGGILKIGCLVVTGA